MLDAVVALGWPLLIGIAVGSVIVGFSKTSFGGLGAVSAAVLALLMPAKESTAALLLLLIVGDIVAICIYRGHASWPLLRRLLPYVLPGLLLGTVFMAFVSDDVMRRTIGIVLLATLAIQLWQRTRKRTDDSAVRMGPLAVAATGAAAGFTTMTANAAGPVMALFLLASRVDMKRFIGTNAWFFALVNVAKLPFTATLGLFTPQVLTVAAVGVAFVLIGAALGRAVIGRVTQTQFEWVTLMATAAAAVSLLIR